MKSHLKMAYFAKKLFCESSIQPYNTQILSLMQCNYCRSDQFKFKPIVAPWCNFPFTKKIQSHLLSYCLHLFGAATVAGRLLTYLKRPRKSNVEVKMTKRLDFRQLLCLFFFNLGAAHFCRVLSLC